MGTGSAGAVPVPILLDAPVVHEPGERPAAGWRLLASHQPLAPAVCCFRLFASRLGQLLFMMQERSSQAVGQRMSRMRFCHWLFFLCLCAILPAGSARGAGGDCLAPDEELLK